MELLGWIMVGIITGYIATSLARLIYGAVRQYRGDD